MSRRRVVVTGLGMLSPLGNTVESSWQAALAGKSGIGPIEHMDVSAFSTRIGGSVRDFEVELITRIRAADRATGRVLLDRELTGRTTIRLGGDLASAERQALPLLANDLAKKTVALLAEGEW